MTATNNAINIIIHYRFARFSFIWDIKLCGWGRWRCFGGILFLDIITLQSFLTKMIKVTSQMRHFVETRGCLFVAVTVLAVLWVSQRGERGEVITLHWFTAQHPLSTTQEIHRYEGSFALSLKSMVKWFRKYNSMNIKLHQTYPGLIGNDQNIPFYEKPRPAFSTMNYVVWYRASDHVLCSYCNL